MAQPRDWRGRWTSGGGWAPSGTLTNSNSRIGIAGGGRITRVTKIQGGKGVRPSVAQANRVTRHNSRPGSPLGGNKNIRYVSRTQATIGGLGRPVSTAGRNRTSPPRAGYVVAYGPRI